MAVRKEVVIADALYVRFVYWQQAHPESNWNQFVREAIEAKLNQDASPSAATEP